MDSELKEQALRNKAIMEGSISDDESSNDGWRRWESHEITYHDHNEIEYKNETCDERQELCEAYKLLVYNIRKFKMIKYSFGQDEEYVVIKEDEYDDLSRIPLRPHSRSWTADQGNVYPINPNNNNGWIEVDVPLLGELGAEADGLMIGLCSLMNWLSPIVEMEEGLGSERGVVDAPVTPPSMPVVPSLSTYEVGGPSTATTQGQSFTLPAPGFPVPPSVIKELSTRMGNLEYVHGQLVKNVIQVSDVEVEDGITIREIGPKVSAVEGQVQVMASEMVKAVGRLEQQRDVQIQQLQTMVSEISSRESTLMQCILGMDRRLADLQRRPPGPQ
ncbi:hypothetical protein Tco_0326863 [Tanacetum coccineum]